MEEIGRAAEKFLAVHGVMAPPAENVAEEKSAQDGLVEEQHHLKERLAGTQKMREVNPAEPATDPSQSKPRRGKHHF